ncbi:MAG: family 16 glycosylhydrolase [Eubacterium sp.]|nr:family 16 glycosylhydrolase [Eubacterium sp.]
MFKRITSVALVAAMTATMFATAPVKKAQAAVTIFTDKSIKLAVGEDELIGVLEKNAKFTSSNKKIATVTKKGDVKAKKVGKCKITVTVGSSKKKVTVKVCPKKVKMKSVSVVGSNSAESAAKIATIRANWKKVKGASGYEVYYSSNQKKDFKKVTVKGGKKTSATIKKLPYGSTYYVKVKAYVKSGKKKISSASYSKVLSAKTYSLTWSDEFNYTDKSKLEKNWVYEVGHGKNGWGNGEEQHYVKERNVSLDGKVLTIQPKYETIICNDIKKEEYTSARMISKGKQEFMYGKVEFRAMVPSAQGTWAALWMQGGKKEWPLRGEIDIMETMCDANTLLFQLDKIPQTIHCGRFNGDSSSSGPKNGNGARIVKGSTTGYHIYSIIWTEKVIDFYIDGKKNWTYDPNKYVLDGKGTSQEDIWPYNKDFFLLMNVAIGGTLGGNPKKDEIIGPKGQMKVDYVRVYQ